MPEIRVPVFGRFVESYPKGPAVEYQRLSEALTGKRRKDVFLTQYSNPDVPYRLEPGSGVPPCMVLAVFDIDGPDDPAWIIHERPKYRAVVEDMGAFAYETRGGYRLVFELPEPRFLRTPEDASRWTADYLSWCKFLNRKFGIVADTACANWSRLFRVPHATRDKGGEPENLPTLGPAHDPGIWCPELAPEDVVAPDVRERGQFEKTPIGDIGKRTALALALAEDLPPAIEGQRGHDTLLRAVDAIYRGLGVPRDIAFQVIEDVYNPRCDPQWKAKEIDHKFAAVERNADGWGEDFDAYELVEVAERLSPRNKEPEDDEGPPVPAETGVVVEWGNAGTAVESLRDLGDPVPTGFATMDRISDGGQLPKEPFIIGGAPGAGKTTLALTIAIGWARTRGLRVGLGAWDESKARLAVRVGQALGHDRAQLRGGAITNEQRAELNSLPIRIFNGRLKGMTIEHVAKKLGEHGPGVLVLDSLQTSQIAADDGRMNEHQRIQARCAAVRAVGEEHGHIVIATSEINRQFYTNYEQALDLNPLAAFSGGHEIESLMSFGVLLLVPPSPAEHVLARVAKNRLGGGGCPDFALQFERARATAFEIPLPSNDEQDSFDPSEAPSIDLERVLWNAVRDTKLRLRGRAAAVAVLQKQGLRFKEHDALVAWSLLESTQRIRKADDGFFIAEPWPTGI